MCPSALRERCGARLAIWAWMQVLMSLLVVAQPSIVVQSLAQATPTACRALAATLGSLLATLIVQRSVDPFARTEAAAMAGARAGRSGGDSICGGRQEGRRVRQFRCNFHVALTRTDVEADAQHGEGGGTAYQVHRGARAPLLSA